MFLENLPENSSANPSDECSIEITLTFIGDDLNKNEITASLGHEPTFAWNCNEILELGASKRIKITDTGKWSLKSVAKLHDLDTALAHFLNKLPSDKNLWLKLTNKHEAYIEITGYNNSWNHNYAISSTTLKLLTEKNFH